MMTLIGARQPWIQKKSEQIMKMTTILIDFKVKDQTSGCIYDILKFIYIIPLYHILQLCD